MRRHVQSVNRRRCNLGIATCCSQRAVGQHWVVVSMDDVMSQGRKTYGHNDACAENKEVSGVDASCALQGFHEISRAAGPKGQKRRSVYGSGPGLISAADPIRNL